MSGDEIITLTRAELDEIIKKAVAEAVAPLLEEIRILREENRILREENRILREENRILRERLAMRYAKFLKERQDFMSRNCASAVMYHGR